MGKGLQVVTGFVTAPSTTFTAWTMASGDTLSVRNSPPGSLIQLIDLWADNQSAGEVRLRSPLLHDNVVGIEAGIVASEVYPLLEPGMGQMLYPQDLLIAEQTGSATSGDIETGAFLAYYENMPGAEANLSTWEAIRSRIESYMLVKNTLALGTAGGYSGEQVINTTQDQWKANRNYALLGYLCSVECAVVGWRGPDTSGLRVGGPGNETNRNVTRNWFVDLARKYNLPLIPIFNAANKGATLIDGVQDENGVDSVITSIFALLR